MKDTQDRPLIAVIEGEQADRLYACEDLWGEAFDLMRRRLPDVDPSDPLRPATAAFLADLGRRLGRDRLVAVPEARSRRSS